MEIVTCILIGATLIAAGIILIIIGSKNKLKPMLISGWALAIIALIGAIVGTILLASRSEQSFVSTLITYAFPAMMLIGFIIAIGVGVGNLIKGYEKDKEGKVNTNKIIAGWALLILSILLVLAVIIPLTIVFDQQSSGDANEIRFM